MARTAKFSISFSFLVLLAGGCSGLHIARNSTQVGLSLEQTIQQQVLDNLAKFQANPDAMPHLTVPNLAASDVTQRFDSGPGFNFDPFGLTGWSIGLTGNHTDDAGFTLTTITDPTKLALMRCVYQHAIYGECQCAASGSCPNCELLFRKFYFGTEFPDQSPQISPDGHAMFMYDPEQIEAVSDSERGLSNSDGANVSSIMPKTEIAAPKMLSEEIRAESTAAEIAKLYKNWEPGLDDAAENKTELQTIDEPDASEVNEDVRTIIEEMAKDSFKLGQSKGAMIAIDEFRKGFEAVEEDMDDEGYEVSSSKSLAYLEYDAFNVPVLKDTGSPRTLAIGKKAIDLLKKKGIVRVLYEKQTLSSLSRRTGRITPACLGSGWICSGKPKGAIWRRSCRKVGSYCGSNIWVPIANQDELSKLTIVVLQLALQDPPEITKEVKKEQTINLVVSQKPSEPDDNDAGPEFDEMGYMSGALDNDDRIRSSVRDAIGDRVRTLKPGPLVPDVPAYDLERSPNSIETPYGVLNRFLDLTQ